METCILNLLFYIVGFTPAFSLISSVSIEAEQKGGGGMLCGGGGMLHRMTETCIFAFWTR